MGTSVLRLHAWTVCLLSVAPCSFRHGLDEGYVNLSEISFAGNRAREIVNTYINRTNHLPYYRPKDIEEYRASYPKTYKDAKALYGCGPTCDCCEEEGELLRTETWASPNFGGLHFR